MNMEAMIDKYFRPGRLPHIWCQLRQRCRYQHHRQGSCQA